ncbi:MAG: rod-binding protein [Defluviitaleaceae bacterium]|nr:rod-binding protein [Defluviitaleaceae bacterium]
MDLFPTGNNFVQQMHMTTQRDLSTRAFDAAALTGDDAALWNAAVEFEAFFINMMFREMRNTVNREDGIIPMSMGEEVFQEKLDTEMSAAAARGNGIGLAQVIFRQMSRGPEVVAASYLVNRNLIQNEEE